MNTNQCLVIHNDLKPPTIFPIDISLNENYSLIGGNQDSLIRVKTKDNKQIIIIGPVMQLDSSRGSIAIELSKSDSSELNNVLSTFSGEYAVICGNTIRQDFVGLFGLCVFEHKGRRAVSNSPNAFKRIGWDLGRKDDPRQWTNVPGDGQWAHVKHLYASQICTLDGELLHQPLLLSPPPSALGVKQFAKKCANAYMCMIRQLHARASANRGKLALGLTAGKDSVGILGAAHRAGVPLVCFTLDHNEEDLAKARERAKRIGYPHHTLHIDKSDKFGSRWDERVGDECREKDRDILRNGALGFLPPGSIMIMGNGPEWIGRPSWSDGHYLYAVRQQKCHGPWKSWTKRYPEKIPANDRAFIEGRVGVWLRNNQRPYTLDVHPGMRRSSWPISRELFHLSLMLPEGKRNNVMVQDKILRELCPELTDTRININPERLLKKFNLLVFIEIEGFSTPNMIETIEDNINNTECLVNYYYSKNNTNKVTLDKATEVKGSTEAVRNKILDIAYSQDVDFLWYLNSKNIITNKNILGNLILRNKSIIGPMLTKKHEVWSNFWRNIDENGWYKRAPDYLDIVNRSLTGCWNVMHLYGNYLINKETISKVKNFYSGNFNKNFSNDMIFSKNCRDHNIPMYIENTEYNGYIYDLKDTIPSNVVHREFYTFEIDREAWTKKYLHPEFYKAISNWNKLDYTEPCHYVYHFPFVSDTFCKHLLDEVNNVNLWSNGITQDSKLDKRIGAVENIPTIDIHMKQIGFRKQWESIVKTYIGPLVSHLYSPYKTKGLNMAFVVKYELGKQEFLRPHHDSSTYSITITLNRPGIDFEGGGTRFVKQETLVVGKKGFATIQPGKLTHYHEGTPITKGIRFIMVSFVN